MSGYCFWENLSGLSVSKDKDECLKEWHVIYKSKKGSTDKNSGEELRCICGREIKNFCILINKFNDNHIKMGCKCVKKLHDNNINNKIDTTTESIKKNIIELFEKGGYYSQIENLDKYAEDIFIEYIMSKEDKIYYIHDIIDKYKENQDLYNIIEQILMVSIEKIKEKQKIKYMLDIINIYKDKKDLYKKIEKILIKDIWKTPVHTITRYMYMYEHNNNLYRQIEIILDKRKKYREEQEKKEQSEILKQQAQIKEIEEAKAKEREEAKAKEREEAKAKEREAQLKLEAQNKERKEKRKMEENTFNKNDIRKYLKML